MPEYQMRGAFLLTLNYKATPLAVRVNLRVINETVFEKYESLRIFLTAIFDVYFSSISEICFMDDITSLKRVSILTKFQKFDKFRLSKDFLKNVFTM